MGRMFSETSELSLWCLKHVLRNRFGTKLRCVPEFQWRCSSVQDNPVRSLDTANCIFNNFLIEQLHIFNVLQSLGSKFKPKYYEVDNSSVKVLISNCNISSIPNI